MLKIEVTRHIGKAVNNASPCYSLAKADRRLQVYFCYGVNAEMSGAQVLTVLK